MLLLSIIIWFLASQAWNRRNIFGLHGAKQIEIKTAAVLFNRTPKNSVFFWFYAQAILLLLTSIRILILVLMHRSSFYPYEGVVCEPSDLDSMVEDWDKKDKQL